MSSSRDHDQTAGSALEPAEGLFAVVSSWRGPVVKFGRVSAKTASLVGGGRVDLTDILHVYRTEADADAGWKRHQQVMRDGQADLKPFEDAARAAQKALSDARAALRQRARDALSSAKPALGESSRDEPIPPIAAATGEAP